MKTTSKALALLSLMCLAACDSRTAASFREERANRQYQEAMDDYTAGRLDAAAKGFERVLRANPGNASARFQLACLQQDSRHDYVGAFCNYREYLLIAPDSDKAKLAKERLAICEKHLADEFAKRLNLTGKEAIAEESSRLRGELAALKAENEKLSRALDAARAKAEAGASEAVRLRKLLATMGEGDEAEAAPRATLSAATIRDLLDGDDEAAAPDASSLGEAKALDALDDDGGDGASPLLPRQAADAKERKRTAEDAGKREKSARAAERDAIPETYVVQEGDTLYKIALRFYGKTSAWRRIREANKDTISTDGRVREGQTIRLPK